MKDIKLFECLICDTRFTYKHDLKKHVDVQHEEKVQNKCGKCGKVLPKTHLLGQHKKNC